MQHDVARLKTTESRPAFPRPGSNHQLNLSHHQGEAQLVEEYQANQTRLSTKNADLPQQPSSDRMKSVTATARHEPSTKQQFKAESRVRLQEDTAGVSIAIPQANGFLEHQRPKLKNQHDSALREGVKVSSKPATRMQRHDDVKPSAPTIHVTIGRIEVRAVSPAQQPVNSVGPASLKMTLDQYLQRRSGPT